MKTRLEEVEEMLKKVDDDLYGKLFCNPMKTDIYKMISEKVRLEIEKSKLICRKYS